LSEEKMYQMLRKIIGEELLGNPFHLKIDDLGTEPIRIPLADTSTGIFIRNKHDTNDVFISFDGGIKWHTIPAKGWFSMNLKVTGFMLKASNANTPIEAIIGLRGAGEAIKP